MKKMLKYWQKLPVKIQACGNIALICLCALLIYIAIGSPALSARHAFRRAEKAELVGPSKILAHIRPDGTAYNHLILADNGDSVILFTWNRRNRDATDLLYVEKTGDLTIAAAPDQTLFFLEKEAHIPIVLFHSDTRAVHAELDLTLSADYQGQNHQNTYRMKADRLHDGCFIFGLRASSRTVLGAEGQLFFMLQSITGNSMADTADVQIPAVIRLYGADGQLVAEQTLSLRSSAARAHQDEIS